MNIVKLPSGKWVNLEHVMQARWTKAIEGVKNLAVEFSDGSGPWFDGEDALALEQALDNATEDYYDFSKKAQP